MPVSSYRNGGTIVSLADERQRRREHLTAVVRSVLVADALSDERWKTLAVVFSISDGGRNFGNGGYAYGADGQWWAFSCSVEDVKPAVIAFLGDSNQGVPQALCRVLLQYDRGSQRARLVSEIDTPERWSITAGTARTMIRELRPNFDNFAGSTSA
ncbi:hypothetical protein FP026_24690 [Rhizobium tropici]|uniref:Uncharacterized protein n=1 Tax=Rhizobium tropici TaxID=398 RepID=A0A5B0VU11_RHITR|nr:hypothetical protein [Rhizobium tropici]KAA1177381.1 hypothetical protein FP026_24690 [Rhizobium tropici]